MRWTRTFSKPRIPHRTGAFLISTPNTHQDHEEPGLASRSRARYAGAMIDWRRQMPVTVTEIWRYPVKSMGGERLDNVAVDERGMAADRMWAVRDPELGSITTARRRPALLRCGARYPADPLGSAPEVVIVLPDGEEISSADPAVHARLSELVGSESRYRLLPIRMPTGRRERPRPISARTSGSPRTSRCLTSACFRSASSPT